MVSRGGGGGAGSVVGGIDGAVVAGAVGFDVDSELGAGRSIEGAGAVDGACCEFAEGWLSVPSSKVPT